MSDPEPRSRLESDEPAPRPKRWLVWALAVALILALIAVGTLAILLFQSGSTTSDVADFIDEEGTRVEDRAERIVDLLLNYDATTIEQVAQDMLAISTGNFRQQYEQLIVGGSDGGLAEALEEAAASSRGQLLDGPDVSFRSPSEAVAIARVTQTAQSSETPTGRTIEYVLELTLVNTADAGWKADRVEVLSQTES